MAATATWCLQPSRRESVEHDGNIHWDYIPDSQEGFLEEGTSQLRLEGRVGANVVEREEFASSTGKGMCKATGRKEQGEFGKPS